jgi:HB1, ASXL, restriction endonuclease HTH domain
VTLTSVATGVMLTTDLTEGSIDMATKKSSKRQTKSKATPQAAEKAKLSALDAAALVLEEKKEPLSCPELIEAMAAKGYWKSPGGKTPSATLYSALKREITTKHDKSRFQQSGPGKFTLA